MCCALRQLIMVIFSYGIAENEVSSGNQSNFVTFKNVFILVVLLGMIPIMLQAIYLFECLMIWVNSSEGNLVFVFIHELYNI